MHSPALAQAFSFSGCGTAAESMGADSAIAAEVARNSRLEASSGVFFPVVTCFCPFHSCYSGAECYAVPFAAAYTIETYHVTRIVDAFASFFYAGRFATHRTYSARCAFFLVYTYFEQRETGK